MEHFFTPTRRLQHWYPDISDEPLDYTEVQLAGPIEAFLNHRWDWSDFLAFLGDEGETFKILWITDDTFICVEDGNHAVESTALVEDYDIQCALFMAKNGETHVLVLAKIDVFASLSAAASSIFWHAVSTSNCVKLKLDDAHSWFGLCSGPGLLHFWKRARRLSF
jgi:hypothetical protein